MISRYKVNGVVFLSGDIHIAEILKEERGEIYYPLHEITSSGLTHYCLKIEGKWLCEKTRNAYFADRYL